MERKLAVILASDIVSYSRLVATDEEGTLTTLSVYRQTICDLVVEHGGRVFGSAGDSLVAEFPSAVRGVRAAVMIQRALRRRNADLSPDRRLEFRIGLHLGDVVVEGADLLGDGVNVATRLEEVAQPNGICISGTLREQIEGKLDFPLTNLGERRLKNLPRPVSVHGVGWHIPDPSVSGALGGPLAVPDKPSIAVLPFTNLSGDPEQEYFADGVVEDIITALSHYRWFFVIARNSSFTYKGRSVDVKQIARELGVRYVLEGSARKAGGRVRVTAQLIDAETGAHLWAERYDRDITDIFAIQDELTQSVVAAIEPEILMGEGRRALTMPTENLDAYECSMRGMWHHLHATTEHVTEAIVWYRRALELDPNFARAHMGLARSLWANSVFGWSDDIARDRVAMCTAAERALALDDRDPYAHYVVFGCHMLHGRLEQALAEAQRAIDLNPNFALGFMSLGWVRIFLGHFAKALEPLHTALRLSPHDPMAYMFLSRIAQTHYHLGNYEEALHHGERALSQRRLHYILLIVLASMGQLGRLEEARALMPEIIAAEPADAAHYWQVIHPYANSNHRAHLYEGLRKAGFANLR